MKRRQTSELQAIMNRERVFVAPPSMPGGISLREWFVGIALSNPSLMKDIDPDSQASESLRIADELIKALASPKAPTLESMAAPTEEEMIAWDKVTADKNNEMSRRTRATIPEIRKTKTPQVQIRKPTLSGIPTPHSESQPIATAISSSPVHRPNKSVDSDDAGRYTIVLKPTNKPEKYSHGA